MSDPTPTTPTAHAEPLTARMRVRTVNGKLTGTTVGRQRGHLIDVDWDGVGQYPAVVTNLVVVS